MKRILSVLLIFVLFTCSGCSRLAFLPQEDASLQPTYQKACDLLKEGNYEEAYPLFLSLGDYKDSADHAKKFFYQPIEILAQDDGFGEELVYHKTTYTYDEKGILLRYEGGYTKEEGPGFSEQYTFDDEGKKIRTDAISEAGDSTITYEYNDKGQIIKQIGFTEGANVGGITRLTYDDQGNRIAAEIASYLGTDPAGYETSEPYYKARTEYTYNEQGYCTKMVENSGESNIFTYTITYNDRNLPTSLKHTDGSGFSSETVFSYDEQGRCTRIDTDYDVTEFSYEEGNLPAKAVRTRDGGKPCEITYTYQLFYLEEAPQFPFYLEEHLAVLEV